MGIENFENYAHKLNNPSKVDKPKVRNPLGNSDVTPHPKRIHNNCGFERKKGNNLYNRFRRRMRRDLFR